MPLGELAPPLGGQDDGQVGEDGRLPAEGPVHQDVLGDAGQPLVGPHDVADLHQVVVHHIGQMIGRVAVGLEEHQVVQAGVVHGDVAVEYVMEGGLALQGDLEAHHRHDALGLVVGTLFGGQIATVAVVAKGWLAPTPLLLPQLGQALRAAVAVVGMAGFDELASVLLVDVQPLGLEVGAVVAPHLGPLVPLQAQPAQALHDVVQGILAIAGAVRVLDAQDEDAVVVAGEEPVEESRPGSPHMEITRGAGGEADTYRFVPIQGHDSNLCQAIRFQPTAPETRQRIQSASFQALACLTQPILSRTEDFQLARLQPASFPLQSHLQEDSLLIEITGSAAR